MCMTTAKAIENVNRVIDEAIADNRLVGAVVIAFEDGKEILTRAAGFADREAKKPMYADSIFRLSSLTKPIVSAAIMSLVEDGLIDLDAPISKYLPSFRPKLPIGAAPDILIRHLLAHRAGLSYRFAAAEGSPFHVHNVSDGMDQPGLDGSENMRRLANVPLSYAPGEGWGYSLSIDVLGAAVEAVTGERLGAIVKHRVTGPLGMSDTDFRFSDPARVVKPYMDGATGPVELTDGTSLKVNLPGFDGAVEFMPSRITNEASFHSGGAGMAGTAPDMARFLETIRMGGAPVLKKTTVDEMLRDHVGTQAETQGPGWGFGFGWAVLADQRHAETPQSQGTIQWGGVYGHYWFVDPVRRLTLVSLTNTTWEGMCGAFPFAVRDALYY
ncbi:beta-lactamase family protein [Ensifer sp. ENS12]|nr:beta-lactamase family protein [Ensifer sp. ENS12]